MSDFSLSKDEEREWLSRVRTRYKKLLESKKHRKRFLLKNYSANDDLESES
jgi:hypothetical protein